MRFFKKEGNVKFRKTTDLKMVEELTTKGWIEDDKSGSLISNKPKKSKKNKEDK